MRIEKRLPFGFKGEWGKVYKLYTHDETNNDAIEWQKSSYVDIGQDIQLKYIESGVDKTVEPTQIVRNLIAKGEYRTAKTTDAYFNAESGNFECVVSPSDILFAFGCYWVCDKIDERSIFTPSKQTFYYLGLKKITDKIIHKTIEIVRDNTEITRHNVVNSNIYLTKSDDKEMIITWADGTIQKTSARGNVEFAHTYRTATSGIETIYSEGQYSTRNAINGQKGMFGQTKENPNYDVINIKLSSKVKNVGSYSFYYLVNLENIYIGARQIAYRMTWYCNNIINVHLNGSINDYIDEASGLLGAPFDKHNLYINEELAKEIYINGAKRAVDYAFDNNLTIEKVTIGSLTNSTEIGGICEYCSNLKKVAFDNNSNITNLAFTFQSANIIGELDLSNTKIKSLYSAFEYNKNLTKVILPASIESIDDFHYCNSLKYIKILATKPPQLDREIRSSIKKIIVPISAVQDYKEAWTFYADIIEGE